MASPTVWGTILLAALGCTFRCDLARQILRLPEGEGVHAVGIGKIIGMTDAFNDILPAADVDARNPSPCILALTVSNMQPGANRTPVRLASDLQLQPRITAVQMLSREYGAP